ncbi:FAD-binding oxidoreductase [Candidatus Halobonum tyrrellensis]|uniref:Oxidoreductase FAD-binding domain-containing protein n=1 Tax=Candidatus Halobonum tyrrellensis G22 TaxID=1324957 RepID=V4HA11_9EURY|nr:FAD-binding oxidoreductase [Candidatus Halobonum tyrrellensis]ESP87550.1 oxidoreductase FAD-binding domain-containing protein [Candidatus Halobonum tyrrellensis G22]
MPVREHNSAHEAAEALPLVTDTAEVTAVEPVDRDRTAEVEERAALLLMDADHPDLVSDPEGDPAVDWDGVRRLLEESHGLRAAKLSTLAGRHDRSYPSLLRIRFTVDDPDFDFVPGQYLTVRFAGTPRPYSVASSPNDDEVELCIRRVPGGDLTTDLFEDLSVGDQLTVRGPNGEFVPNEPSERDVAMLATGTGVAPLHSMIRYAFEEGRDTVDGEERDYWLFLGAGWEDDLSYRDAFESLEAEHDNFHFVPTLSRETLLSGWKGETEYVQRTFVKYLDADAVDDDDLGRFAQYRQSEPAYDIDARIDPGNLEVYACGVTAMVNGITRTAKRIGVPGEHIDGEGFG